MFQMSMVGSVGIASFCFVGGFWPQEMTSLWLDVKPVIVGTKEDMAGYVGSSSGSVVVDPALVLRDIPCICFGTGLADLCEQVLGGFSIRRIKTLASLFAKKKFGTMTLKELKFGFVRVCDWYRQSLSVRQALYAVYDSEVLVRVFLMAIMLEMRGFVGLGVGELTLEVVLQFGAEG